MIKQCAKWILVAALFALGGAYIYGTGPGGAGVLAQTTLEDEGGECLVTQEWLSWGEGYWVHIWFREGNELWAWNDLSFEDCRWRSVSLEHNKSRDSIQVFRGETLWGELFLDSKELLNYVGERKRSGPSTLKVFSDIQPEIFGLDKASESIASHRN